MQNNPYQQLYRSNIKIVTPSTSMKQAQQMATHMSYIYNTFGTALRDLVGLLSVLYKTQNQSIDQYINSEWQNKNKSAMQTESKVVVEKVNERIEKQQQLENRLSEIKQVQVLNRQKPVSQPDFQRYMLDFTQKNNSQKHNQTKFKLKQEPTKLYFRKNRDSSQNQIRDKVIQKPVERIEVVRGKKQRQLLNGYSCARCQQFYKALEIDYSDKSVVSKICNDCSRHRSNLPPTNFNSDFSQQFGFED